MDKPSETVATLVSAPPIYVDVWLNLWAEGPDSRLAAANQLRRIANEIERGGSRHGGGNVLDAERGQYTLSVKEEVTGDLVCECGKPLDHWHHASQEDVLVVHGKYSHQFQSNGASGE